jgi:hypothetical protein
MSASDKYIIYLPKSDVIMMDGDVPYIDTEKNVKWVIDNEVVHKKMYEPKPIKFLKTWAARHKKEEQAKAKESYSFSPMSPEIRYAPQPGQGNFLLILGEEYVRNSGKLVQAFDTVEDAAKLAARSINLLVKEYPNLWYFIYDVRRLKYVRFSNPETNAGSGGSKRKNARNVGRQGTGAAEKQ